MPTPAATPSEIEQVKRIATDRQKYLNIVAQQEAAMAAQFSSQGKRFVTAGREDILAAYNLRIMADFPNGSRLLAVEEALRQAQAKQAKTPEQKA